MFAAIIHAVLVGEYPELNHEHSWDGFNYSMNNSQGCRATITFHPQYVIAVFQDSQKINLSKNVYDYINNMPKDILKIAEEEALFERKILKGEAEIHLDSEEMRNLYGEIEECEKSLRELNIFCRNSKG